ncbi:glyoxylase-like metal-dependent hydrolase (beta-lactamase superfamily II) [Bacillus oleivorans]|uniref:Glyoxylase-like metal-dependent hydrolase (Beta-lactamase superfamily II) n=1 Tax=Bacillus oleivorans TaxID=1448271 RepID=A0A285CUS1_9BACI|nr:MBL fold metallo-hydrolase [Bacillus oleivorans]SNX71339.1 glyoxylase-like metal-dependent hydrolase (beta-lactamase superfamily II) [Bacillus oleivorans]
MEKLQFGSYSLTWLNGGVTNMDGGAMFGVVPKPLWSKKYKVNEKNQIELRTDPILVQDGKQNILIEAGIGNGRFSEKQLRNYGITEESSIDQSLAQLGLTKKDIDKVVMTHMHFDHATGLTDIEDGKYISAFPNAVIYTSKVEWDEMRNPNIRSRNTYWKENWEAIGQQVETFEGELEVAPGFKMIHTGGHSDGHSILLLEQGDEFMIHMADLMPTHAHENVLWVLAYDDYPMTSIAKKQKYITYGKEKQAWFIFYHDSDYRAVRFNPSGEIIESIKRDKGQNKS